MTVVDGIASAHLPADDRGLHYGDGVFETVALVDGQAQHWSRHLARLRAGALALALPMPDEALWQQDLHTALDGAPAADRRVLKLVLTRGSGGRGYAPPAVARPRRLLQVSEWPTWPASHAQQGIRLITCTTPLGRNRLLAGIKHLNRLEQVLGAAEVAAAGAEEGLMFDDRDRLVEGTRTNVFLVVDGALLTPSLEEAGVAGIMRALILDIAPGLGLEVGVAPLDRSALAQASEVFVCNSLAGLWPVRELGGSIVRNFHAWPLCRRIGDALRAASALP